MATAGVLSGSGCGVPPADGADARTSAIWRQWFVTLANSAEAALSAAIAYERLDGAARWRWLHAVENEESTMTVPLIAAFGPLLAVEHDVERRRFMDQTLRRTTSSEHSREHYTCRILVGAAAEPRRVVVLAPTYLNFMQVVTCRVLVGRRFVSVTREPFVLAADAPSAGEASDDGTLEAVPLRYGVDLLARTILAHERDVGKIPEQLRSLADLFDVGWMD